MSAAGIGGAIAPAAAGGSDYSEGNTRHYPELRHWGRGGQTYARRLTLGSLARVQWHQQQLTSARQYLERERREIGSLGSGGWQIIIVLSRSNNETLPCVNNDKYTRGWDANNVKHYI